ncbi:MAG: cytochrome C [Flavobacteriaceae bacterium]|nr:cytochrome C [Flavobacteriaceae bacterium]|tara:strand:+ start:1227 stop:1634 length:408 start_codon:yes stop_codon:yes gene_type:complete
MKIFISIYFIVLYSLFFLIQDKSLSKSIEDGYIVYEDFCLRCHGAFGQGNEEFIPPLNKSDFLNNTENSISIIKFGTKEPITVNKIHYSGGTMIPQGLDDEEIADVLNYIRNSWDNKNEIQIKQSDISKLDKPTL